MTVCQFPNNHRMTRIPPFIHRSMTGITGSRSQTPHAPKAHLLSTGPPYWEPPAAVHDSAETFLVIIQQSCDVSLDVQSLDPTSELSSACSLESSWHRMLSLIIFFGSGDQTLTRHPHLNQRHGVFGYTAQWAVAKAWLICCE